MTKIEQMVDAAYKVALDVCKAYALGTGEISAADKVVLDKYVAMGVIAYSKPKVNITKGVYYPLLQRVEFNNLTKNTFVKIVLAATGKYGIKSNLTLASVNSYCSSSWRYNIEPVELLTPTALGTLLYKEECEAWERIRDAK